MWKQEKKHFSKYELVTWSAGNWGRTRAESSRSLRRLAGGDRGTVTQSTGESGAERSERGSGSDSDVVTLLKVMLLIITPVQQVSAGSA